MGSVQTLEPGRSWGTLRARREVGGFVLSENEFAPGLRIPRHAHAHPRLTLVLRGGFRETYADADLECLPRTAFVVPAGAPHTDTVADVPTRTVSIDLPGAVLPRLESISDRLGRPRILEGAALREPARRLLRELRTDDSASPLALESAVLDLFVLLGRVVDDRREPAWLRRVRDMVHDRFREPLALSELAALGGVHETHLARAFRSHYGCPVGEYQRRLRLEWAGRALRHGRPVSEVALDAGFHDASHFARAFRASFGVSPSEYRAK